MTGWQNYPSFSADLTVARLFVRPELKFIAFIALQQRQRALNVAQRNVRSLVKFPVPPVFSFFLIR